MDPPWYMLDSLPFEMFQSTPITFYKVLLRLERARAWHRHYLADSSDRHEFINSDKFFLSLTCMHLQSLRIWKIYQWHFSNLLCAKCSSKISFWPSGAHLACARSLCKRVSPSDGFCPHTNHHQAGLKGRCPEPPFLKQKSFLRKVKLHAYVVLKKIPGSSFLRDEPC